MEPPSSSDSTRLAWCAVVPATRYRPQAADWRMPMSYSLLCRVRDAWHWQRRRWRQRSRCRRASAQLAAAATSDAAPGRGRHMAQPCMRLPHLRSWSRLWWRPSLEPAAVTVLLLLLRAKRAHHTQRAQRLLSARGAVGQHVLHVGQPARCSRRPRQLVEARAAAAGCRCYAAAGTVTAAAAAARLLHYAPG